MKEIFNKIIRIVKGPDFRVFLVCLFISTLIWSAKKLHIEHSFTTEYKINCINIPQGYNYDTKNDITILVDVKGNLFDKLFDKPRKIDIDISAQQQKQIKNQTYAAIALTRLESILSKSKTLLDDKLELVRVIADDTILLPLQKLEKKLLPIKLNAEVLLEKQTCFSAPTLIEPENVWVSGICEKIDTMTNVIVSSQSQLILHDTMSVHYQFSLPEGVTADFDGIDVTYYVEPSTQNIIEVPITAINVPDGYAFKAFPTTIHVSYSIGLSRFEKITANDFSVIVDLKDIRPGSATSKLKIKLAHIPDDVTNVSYSPISVEFLLEHLHEIKR